MEVILEVCGLVGDGLESLHPRPDGGVGLSLRLGVGQGLHVHQQALLVPSVHGYS
jgi:hypothetical protein